MRAVNSVLAIGGVGGLAVGLAGREILENLFTGLIILSSSPFEVGDEVLFTPPSGPVRCLPRRPFQRGIAVCACASPAHWRSFLFIRCVLGLVILSSSPFLRLMIRRCLTLLNEPVRGTIPQTKLGLRAQQRPSLAAQ